MKYVIVILAFLPSDVQNSFKLNREAPPVYPTFILTTDDSSVHPFLVCVPDMDIFTEGDSFVDAIEMARDEIGLARISMEDNPEKLPIPSNQQKAIEKVTQDTTEIPFYLL